MQVSCQLRCCVNISVTDDISTSNKTSVTTITVLYFTILCYFV